MPLVVAENLVKHYGKVKAVDGLSLILYEGSVTGLIGPNGAGKTTTIKIILGLLKPDSGRVEVFGQDPWDNSKIRTLIGVVYEKAFFPSHQKVIDYLRRACRIFGVPESRALEVLKLVDLQEAYNRVIKALSAGMLQKFAIAHALINYPQLIIADEMTSNLDPQARSSLLDLVLRLNKDENVTFLLSSHILPELSRVCDSIAIINRGRVWALGKLTELYEKYGVGRVRVSTDKPMNFAEEIRRLPYVEELKVDSRGVCIRVMRGRENEFYEDAPKLAKKVKANIYGIEVGSTSLEELYRLVVSSNEPKGA
ncbi:MAG: ABC transporter ATP-binding protein [Candidatus Bathyarchaeia archaeon]